ncbi:MAG: hypothetical protein JNM17_40400 [Archangium sp.]|nr:hypothetical protein [Archangium sp.]
MQTLLVLSLLAAAPEVSQVVDEDDCVPEAPLLAVVAMPGYGLEARNSGLSVALAAEVRLFPWLALRSGYEWRRESSHVIDFLGAKVSPFASWKARPFLATGVSGVFPDSRPGESFLALTTSAGVDVTLWNGFFASLEGRARFMRPGVQGGVFLGLGFEFL